MFNIRNKIYVSYPEDITIPSGEYRVISLVPGSPPTDQSNMADPRNPLDLGVVYEYTNFLEFVNAEFGGNIESLFSWLNTESSIWIVVGRDDDYARLFAMMLIELREQYQLSRAHTLELLHIHKLKNFFTGRPSSCDIIEAFQVIDTVYQPVGGLVDDPSVLPLEYVLYLHKHGYLDKVTADQKISSISKELLGGFVRVVTTNIRDNVANNQSMIREFTGIDNIISTEAAIVAIQNDQLLNTLFFSPHSLDFDNPTTLSRIREWTRLCVENEVLYPEERERQLYEHNLFYQLVDENDVDLVINNIIPFTQYGFIDSRGQKFNVLLLATLYPLEADATGTYVVSNKDDDWTWSLLDADGIELSKSVVMESEASAITSIDVARFTSRFATIS